MSPVKVTGHGTPLVAPKMSDTIPAGPLELTLARSFHPSFSSPSNQDDDDDDDAD